MLLAIVSGWMREKVSRVPSEFNMRGLDTSQFQDADKYASYLDTTAGKLRSELAWENLRRLLPGKQPGFRVLDLGGGTGSMSLRLGRMEYQVVLLDGSEEMLGIARKEAEASEVAARIAFRQADASELHNLFEAESFDIVVCHNLLEYVADPCAILRSIAQVARKDAVVSILVRNRAGEVLKAAIKSGDRRLAKANLSAETVIDSLFHKPVRIFDPTEIRHALAHAGLDVVAEYGVRVFSDYLDSEDFDGEAYRQLLEMEFTLGAQPQFAAIARYSQFIARGSCAPPGNGI
jgi:S-adenosylmethionine-dependent methyltransferase